MDEAMKSKVCEKVYRKFPETREQSPKVQARPNGEELLIFQSQVKLETGAVMNRTVRVVVNEKGKVLKITTSR